MMRLPFYTQTLCRTSLGLSTFSLRESKIRSTNLIYTLVISLARQIHEVIGHTLEPFIVLLYWEHSLLRNKIGKSYVTC